MSYTRVSKESKFYTVYDYDKDLENCHQSIIEKDVIINNNNERLKELEQQVIEYEEKMVELCQKNEYLQSYQIKCTELEKINLKLENRIKDAKNFAEVPSVVSRYDELVKEAITKYETVKEQRNTIHNHLLNMETAFADLIEKYERTKQVLLGYHCNQECLIQHLETNRNAMSSLEKKYEELKKYSREKLLEVNAEVAKTDKHHSNQIAKLKAKLIQSQSRIKDLENRLAIISTNLAVGDTPLDDALSPFTPLSNHFIM